MDKFIRYGKNMYNLKSIHKFEYGYSKHHNHWWICITVGFTNSSIYIAEYRNENECKKEFYYIQDWIGNKKAIYIVGGEND